MWTEQADLEISENIAVGVVMACGLVLKMANFPEKSHKKVVAVVVVGVAAVVASTVTVKKEPFDTAKIQIAFGGFGLAAFAAVHLQSLIYLQDTCQLSKDVVCWGTPGLLGLRYTALYAVVDIVGLIYLGCP